jgi:putative tryptophan/tyrosine transport system substrate-binding protein
MPLSEPWGWQVRRRDFINAVAGAAAVWPLAAHAQQADGKAHVGVLGPGLDNVLARTGFEAFTAELQKLGFSQGKNLQLEYRRTDQGMDLAIAGARELVAVKSNVIVAVGLEISLRAALAPNSGLPIVILAFNYDPIARGYVETLAHPGGNITGVFTRQPELAVKQLQLLVEAFPERNQLGILWDDQTIEQFDSAEQEAQKNRLAMKSIKLTSAPYDFEKAFRTAKENGVQMLLVLSSPLFAPHNEQIVDLTMRYQLPAMFTFKFYVEAGGLMSYGVDTDPRYRRGAAFVAKILRGAKASDLPVEQASNFEFTVNLKTAKAAGFTLPTSILLRANEVIE